MTMPLFRSLPAARAAALLALPAAAANRDMPS